MINALEDFKVMDCAGAQVALIEGFGILLRCLYPATPHIAHSLWSQLGYAGTLGDLPVSYTHLDVYKRQKLANPDTEVQLRADRGVAYGRIVEVMGAAQKAGLSRIGFVADNVVVCLLYTSRCV